MGGGISLDRKKGSWSKFTVDLPCCDEPLKVSDIASNLRHLTVLIVGAAEDEEKSVMRVFTAYKVHIETFESMSDMKVAISGDGALLQDRGYVCLVHEDAFEKEAYRHLFTRVNLALVTFGHQFKTHDDVVAHHIRSLEKTIPSVLLETLSERARRSTEPQLYAASRSDDSFSLAQLRVLIAEDNTVNQKVLLRMLNRLGVTQVDIVGNGLKACEKEATQDPPYDVILMDDQMPIMSGVSACRRIVDRTGGHKRPKVVFVTAHASSDFEDEFTAAGGNGFIPKPFKIDQIEKCLRMLYLHARSQ